MVLRHPASNKAFEAVGGKNKFIFKFQDVYCTTFILWGSKKLESVDEFFLFPFQLFIATIATTSCIKCDGTDVTLLAANVPRGGMKSPRL